MIDPFGNYNPESGEFKDPELVTGNAKIRIRRWVIAIHVSLIVIPLVWFSIYEWVKPAPKVIKIKLLPPPPPSGGTPDTPVVKQPKVDKPKPKAEQPKPKPRPKPKPKPRRKPKTKRLTAKDIRISRDVVKKNTPQPKPQPKLRRLSKDDLARKLNQAVSKYNHNIKADRYDPNATLNYQEMVGLKLKQLWNEPDKRQLGGRYPEVTIQLTISGSGRVTSAKIIRASGVGAMDRSVLKLLNSLRYFPKPPGGRSVTFPAIMEIARD